MKIAKIVCGSGSTICTFHPDHGTKNNAFRKHKFKLTVFSVYVLPLNVHNYLVTNWKESDFSVVAATNILCLFKSCRSRKVEPINSRPCCPDELKRTDKTEKYG